MKQFNIWQIVVSSSFLGVFACLCAGAIIYEEWLIAMMLVVPIIVLGMILDTQIKIFYLFLDVVTRFKETVREIVGNE